MKQPTDSTHSDMPYTGGTTSVPNELLDLTLPELRDTELRVLLVIVRQTLGWQDDTNPGRRKERDWLTQSQLMHRTGRASEAVARAIDGLVRRGLIDVLDRSGTPLLLAVERRRHLGRLYYRLRPRNRSEGGSQIHRQVPKSEYAKPNTTKESKYKNISKVIRSKTQIVEKPVENPVVIRGGWFKAGTEQRKNNESLTL